MRTNVTFERTGAVVAGSFPILFVVCERAQIVIYKIWTLRSTS